jgi:sugar/nucleoside kinase (ribokinase family)
MHDLCCVGHITLDKVITPRATRFMAGGTSWYFSHALGQLDIDYLLVTALASTEMSSVDRLSALGIAVQAWPSKHSVYFENSYGADLNHRTQRVLQIADPFSVDQLADVHARYYHLGALLVNDIPLDVIRLLSTRGRVSLDAQGYLRTVRDERVHAVDWHQKREALPYISILKVNDDEMLTLTGYRTVEDGAKALAGWGVKEVVITLGSDGSYVYHDEVLCRIPAYAPRAEVDATGCGDTYMAGYLYQRCHHADVQQAGEFAAAMASKKIEASGPFTGTKEDVLQIVRTGSIQG